MSLKNKLKTALAMFVLAAAPYLARAEDMLYKYTAELSWKKDNDVLVVRPFDYAKQGDKESQSTDVCIGHRFSSKKTEPYINSFVAYLNAKRDRENRDWAGFRLDSNSRWLDEKLRLKIESRFLYGLDSKSSDETQFMPTLDYLVWNAGIGLKGVGKKSEGKDAVFYFGPSININFTRNFGLNIVYGGNCLGDFLEDQSLGFKAWTSF